jgi:DNA primase
VPYISQSSIQELTDRLDAAAVASDYVQLERRGGRLWACCPFHQEKTASFTVNADLKTYYCFGCHKGGTMINFVMEMDKISFPEAIELLAKRFGLELIYEHSGGKDFFAEDDAKKKQKEELFELYHRISGTFHHFLLKNPEAEPVKHYIITRGIGNEMIERFGLGYAPADRYWLYKFLSGKGYSGEFLSASGLFSSRDTRSSLFSGRLMFPIADRQGRTVAFGGRCLEEQTVKGYQPPKYINSPELGIYKKGETLYAVDLALPEIRKTKTAYIAEGYMDVIALHQAGITNALAPLGTAFTDNQAKLLKRWAEKVIFFFDSDGAGQSAAIKGIYTCRKNGLACAVIVQEEAPEQAKDPADILKNFGPEAAPPKDPADILKKFGPEALQKKAKCFINDFDYLLARAKSLYNLTGAEGKAKAIAFLFPYLEILDSEIARNSCIETAADTFGVLPLLVSDEYRRYTQGRGSAGHAEGISPRKEETRNEPGGRTPVRTNDELSLLIAVALDYVSSGKENLFAKFRAALEINEIEDKNAREVFIALEECVRYDEKSMHELLARIGSPELKDFMVGCSASGEFSVNSEQLVADGIKGAKSKRLKRRQEEIIIKLREIKNIHVEEQNSEAPGLEVRELLSEKMRVDEELYQLKQGR